MFKKVLLQYPKIFPDKLLDRGLFMNVYGQVCTRCFGYGLPSCSMIPMADNINHNSVDVTNELVNLDKHVNGDEDSEYFRIAKFMNDIRPIYDKKGIDVGPRTLNI